MGDKYYSNSDNSKDVKMKESSLEDRSFSEGLDSSAVGDQSKDFLDDGNIWGSVNKKNDDTEEQVRELSMDVFEEETEDVVLDAKPEKSDVYFEDLNVILQTEAELAAEAEIEKENAKKKKKAKEKKARQRAAEKERREQDEVMAAENERRSREEKQIQQPNDEPAYLYNDHITYEYEAKSYVDEPLSPQTYDAQTEPYSVENALPGYVSTGEQIYTRKESYSQQPQDGFRAHGNFKDQNSDSNNFDGEQPKETGAAEYKSPDVHYDKEASFAAEGAVSGYRGFDEKNQKEIQDVEFEQGGIQQQQQDRNVADEQISYPYNDHTSYERETESRIEEPSSSAINDVHKESHSDENAAPGYVSTGEQIYIREEPYYQPPQDGFGAHGEFKNQNIDTNKFEGEPSKGTGAAEYKSPDVHKDGYYDDASFTTEGVVSGYQGFDPNDSRAQDEKKRKEFQDAELEQRKFEQRQHDQAVADELRRAGYEREKISENYKSFGSKGIDYSGKGQHSEWVEKDDAHTSIPPSVTVTGSTITDAERDLARLNFEQSRKLFRSYEDDIPDFVVKQYQKDSKAYFEIEKRIDHGDLIVIHEPPAKPVVSVYEDTYSVGLNDYLGSNRHSQFHAGEYDNKGYSFASENIKQKASDIETIGYQEFSSLKADFQTSRDKFLSYEGNVPKNVISDYQRTSLEYLSAVERIENGTLRVEYSTAEKESGTCAKEYSSALNTGSERETRERYLHEKERHSQTISQSQGYGKSNDINTVSAGLKKDQSQAVIGEHEFHSIRNRYNQNRLQFLAYGSTVTASMVAKHQQETREYLSTLRKIQHGDLVVEKTFSSEPAKTQTILQNISGTNSASDSYNGPVSRSTNEQKLRSISQNRFNSLERRHNALQHEVSLYQGKAVPSELSRKAEQTAKLYKSIVQKVDSGQLRITTTSDLQGFGSYNAISQVRYERLKNRNAALQEQISAYGDSSVPTELQREANRAAKKLRGIESRIEKGSLHISPERVGHNRYRNFSSENGVVIHPPKPPTADSIKTISLSKYEYLQRKYLNAERELSNKNSSSAKISQAEKVKKLYTKIQKEIDSGNRVVISDVEFSSKVVGGRKGARAGLDPAVYSGSNKHNFSKDAKKAGGPSALGSVVYSDVNKHNFGKDAKKTGSGHIKPRGTPIQKNPLGSYDKLKIYHTNRFGDVFERAAGKSLRALGDAVVVATQGDETGTVNTMLEARQRVRDAKTALQVLADTPRQLAVLGAGTADFVHGARNAGRFIMGKEQLDPLQHKAWTLRQLERQARNPFTSDEKETLSKTFGSNVNAKFGKVKNGHLLKARTLNSQVEKLEKEIDSILVQLSNDKLTEFGRGKLMESLAEKKESLKDLRKQRKDAFKKIAPAEHQKKIRNQTAKSKNLKDEIKALQAKGAALTADERKKLMELIKQKKVVDGELRKLHSLVQVEGGAIVRNSKVDWVSRKDAKKTLKKTAKNKLNLSKNDKAALERIKYMRGINENRERFQKAKFARKQLFASFAGILVKAAQESEETSVRGLIGASRLIQNRYARTALKYTMKGAMLPLVLTKKTAVGAYHLGVLADAKLNGGRIAAKVVRGVDPIVNLNRTVAKGVRNAEEAAVRKILHSKVYKGLHGGIYNRAKTRISSMVPKGLKTKVNAGLKHLDVIRTKKANVLAKFTKWKDRLAASKVGRFVTSLNKGFNAIGNAFKVVSKLLVRTCLYFGGAFLLFYLLCVIITSAGGSASSFILTDDMKNEKLDLTDYIEVLNDEQVKINKQINEYKKMTEANGGKYRNVNVMYTGDDGTTNNYKEILSMMTVYFDQDFEKKNNVKNYIKKLYKASNMLSATESEMYKCVGCEERTYYCYDATDKYATAERKQLHENYQTSGSTMGCVGDTYYCTERGHEVYNFYGCVQHFNRAWVMDPYDLERVGCYYYTYEYIDRTNPDLGFKYRCNGHCYGNHVEYSCPGHTEKICKGHIDLNVEITCLTFDDIFYCMENPAAGGSTTLVGSETKEKVWNFLKAKGLDDIHAAAIMGNIQQESSFNTSATNGSTIGLCQWLGGRRTALERYASDLGKDSTDLAVQLDFFWMEFSLSASRESYVAWQWIHPSYSYADFLSATTIADATEIFQLGWERSGVDGSLSRRIGYAQSCFDLYAGTAAEPDNSGSSGDATSGGSGSSGDATASGGSGGKKNETAAEDPNFEWSDENQDWAKSIFENLNDESYEGLDKIEYIIVASGGGQGGGVFGKDFDSSALVASGNFVWPVPSDQPNAFYITSPFGYRNIQDEVPGASTYHKGVDVGVGMGTPVCSASDGTVTVVSYQAGGAGYWIAVEHANGITTKYFHLSQQLVSVGQTVSAGELIAYSGDSGIGAAHLHFQIENCGTPYDAVVQYSSISFSGKWKNPYYN